MNPLSLHKSVNRVWLVGIHFNRGYSCSLVRKVAYSERLSNWLKATQAELGSKPKLYVTTKPRGLHSVASQGLKE